MTFRNSMDVSKNNLRLKFIFLIGVVAIYVALVAWLDFLKGDFWWDERIFWQTSVDLSDNLIPNLEELRNYKELNTPLPFVIFGALEHFFKTDVFVGRVFNLGLSLVMVFIIGWPSRQKGLLGPLCLLGLFMCPYYLWLSGRLYTEMIACFWMILGLVGYVNNRYILSSLAMILAIASRQYMLAFPAAIVTYEFIVAIIKIIRERRVEWADQWKWIAPMGAALSILGWFYLFGGLTPQAGLEYRPAPDVQRSLWALAPGGAFNFLAFVGAYIVIPEWLLFYRQQAFDIARHQYRKIMVIAGILLMFFVINPPLLYGSGNLLKVANLLPADSFKIAVFYVFCLLACIRFSKANLMLILIVFHCLIMMKAWPWDRYALPLVMAFWYLKSVGLEEKFLIFKPSDRFPAVSEKP